MGCQPFSGIETNSPPAFNTSNWKGKYITWFPPLTSSIRLYNPGGVLKEVFKLKLICAGGTNEFLSDISEYGGKFKIFNSNG